MLAGVVAEEDRCHLISFSQAGTHPSRRLWRAREFLSLVVSPRSPSPFECRASLEHLLPFHRTCVGRHHSSTDGATRDLSRERALVGKPGQRCHASSAWLSPAALRR